MKPFGVTSAVQGAGSGGRSSADHDLDQSIRFAGAGAVNIAKLLELLRQFRLLPNFPAKLRAGIF
jgi:hypothetical protein